MNSRRSILAFPISPFRRQEHGARPRGKASGMIASEMRHGTQSRFDAPDMRPSGGDSG
jgi:hypothetical protein